MAILAQAAAPAAQHVIVRNAADADIPHIQAIYADSVLALTATFEEIPPSVEEMRSRYAAVRQSGLPYLVADLGGQVSGWAYAAPYRARPAYRHTCEDSVYIAPGLGGMGIGSALLSELLSRCEAGPWAQVIAMIGGSDNAASIRLHARFGFESVGVLRNVGYKFGRWVDIVVMQKSMQFRPTPNSCNVSTKWSRR